MEKKGTIYLITAPNGKKFIIWTTLEPEKNLEQIISSRDGSDLFKSLRVYSLETHSIETLETDVSSTCYGNKKKEWKEKYLILRKLKTDKTVSDFNLVDQYQQEFWTYTNGKWIKKIKNYQKRSRVSETKNDNITRLEESYTYSQLYDKRNKTPLESDEIQEQEQTLEDTIELSIEKENIL